MTNTEERFAALEAQVAALEARDARRESEHVKTAKEFRRGGCRPRAVRDDWDKTYTMLTAS